MSNVDVAARISENAALALASWQSDDIAEYASDEEVKWRAWHAIAYKYNRMHFPLYDIDALLLMPAESNGRIWVSDHPMSFVPMMRNAIIDLFALNYTQAGRRYLVRPGKPAKVTLCRIPLYGNHVTRGVKR